MSFPMQPPPLTAKATIESDIRPQDMHTISLTSLHREFATVINTDTLLKQVE